MSHISVIKVGEVKDLTAFAAACAALGLVFNKDAAQHKAYNGQRHPCKHSVSVKGNSDAYEIGLVDGSEGGYKLHWDNFMGGRGLVAAVGEGGKKLYQEYSAQVAIRQARMKGFTRVSRRVNADGAMVLEISK